MASLNWICDHPKSHLTEVAQPKDGSGSGSGSPPSKCGDCECPIVGKAFHCGACNSDLHPFCKSRPSNFSCQLHPGHPLTLLAGGLASRRCTVCDEQITRVHYTCSHSGCEFDVHPVCSQLPLSIPSGPHLPHPLRLLLGDDNASGVGCDVCGLPCGKWAYWCDVTSATLHYSCLSEKIVVGAAPAGGVPAAAPPPEHQSRGLGQARWVSFPPYHAHHGGGYPHNYYGGEFSGTGYVAGIAPNYNCYNNNYGGGGFQGHQYWVPNNYNYSYPNHHNNGGFQNQFHGGGGSGNWSSGGSGGLGGWFGKIGGSLAVGVICNLIADQIQNAFN